jgi:CheY-like chemotaxis protein
LFHRQEVAFAGAFSGPHFFDKRPIWEYAGRETRGLSQMAKEMAEKALEASASKRTILVVDDEDGIRALLQELLESAGHHAVVAADGREALQVLAQTQIVDLVITDLVMPNQDGVETVQEIRRRYPRTKIIAMSGAFGGQFLRTAELLGACATLAKPINAARLLEAVSKVFEAR